MSKRIAILLCVVMLLSLTGCALKRETIRWKTIPGEKVEVSSAESAESSEETDSAETQEPSTETTVRYIRTRGTRTVMKEPESNAGTGSSSGNQTANVDKAAVSDPGALSSTVPAAYVSKYDKQAKELRNTILNAKDTIKATGTTYYVSADHGSDANTGTSESAPWKTLSKVNAMAVNMKAGDAVLLERGGIYRTTRQVNLVSGVSYGAYGTGDKPCVYGSAKNYATAEWKSIGTNLWRLTEGIGTNVGLIVFDHGRATGYWRFSKDELKNNFDYYTGDGYIDLYLDKNPAKAYSSIEIGDNHHLYWMEAHSHDILIDNICFKYTGGHAVRGSSCKNITVRNLEIGYIGGCILSGYGDGHTRYGNGVEFMTDSQNVLVENNWIYQIYDSGVTHQGSGDYHLNGFTVKNNLIEYCGMGSIEYWHTADCDISNVTYDGNLLRYAGYGFGGTQRPDKDMTGHIMSNGKATGAGYNKATNFVIKNNLFELSTYQLVNATSAAGTPPVLSGNTYVQWTDKWLGYYKDNTNKKFSASVLDILQDTWGDKTAIAVFAD